MAKIQIDLAQELSPEERDLLEKAGAQEDLDINAEILSGKQTFSSYVVSFLIADPV